jgi:tetratricopeptide (TPR) repeat protein
MNPSQIHTTFKTVLNLLSSGKLKQSLEQTRFLVDELQLGEYSDRFKELEQNYQYLLYYFSNDISDPERKLVYNRLVSKLFILSATLREELFFRNASGFEYTQKRYFPHRRRFSQVDGLIDAFKYYYQQTAILKTSDVNVDAELQRLRANYEQLLPELFSVYWLATFYSQNEKDLFSEVITGEKWSFVEQSLLVSALTLNLWRMFDEIKLMMLFDCCNSGQQHVKQRALVGVCFILARYNRFIPYFPSVRNRLVIMADENQTFENFQNILIQIISTSDTDKITRKMQEEILPEVMKISPIIRDKMDQEYLLRSDEFDEENPEWQEIIEKSGVSEKLKELTELQMEGADVYMSTFSMLKNFPFFNEFTNWFLPFDPENSAVNELFRTSDVNLLSAFINNNLMCNSDKYSFCLSVLQMPEMQRNGIKQSFKAESEQLEEMAKDEALLKPDVAAKNISKHYIQDLFRFFRLNPQTKDFSDMFKSSMLMHKSYLFDLLSAGTKLKDSVAEYLFSKNHYEESVELFEEMIMEEPASALLLQKSGYAHQKLKQIDEALDAYIKADMILPDDLWTVKKIAFCYRIKGDYTRALEFYQHADFLKPQQKSNLMNMAGCLEDAGNYKDALSIYLKLNDTIEDVKVLRAIVRNSFLSGNLSGAEYYSDRVLELDVYAPDYIYAGHIALCKMQIKRAIADYKKALDKLERDSFEKAFNTERFMLIKYGIDVNDISLVLDAVLYN